MSSLDTYGRAPARPLQNVTMGMTTLGRSIWKRQEAQHERVSKRSDTVAKAVGKKIRQLRNGKAWSQEFLAEEAGMHRTYLWGIEQGVRNPSIRHLVQIADALGVSVASLFSPGE
jgi:DNA-binding XRE family transcriptional regulator